MAAHRQYRRRKRSGTSSAIWNFLTKRTTKQIRLTGGAILLSVYAYFFYVYIVAPFTQSWRGIYGETHLPEGYSIRGIDVSHHQGDIDWNKVRRSEIGNTPISFVFIKATEGESLVDPKFKENILKAREVGLACGAYHYFLPGVAAEDQARNFIRNVKLQAGDLPPVLDVEVLGDLTKEQLRAETLKWLKIIELHYKTRPILYTYYKFRKQYLNSIVFDHYPYWIAHYYVDTLHYDGAWKFWQHTDRGRVKGIRGNVDINTYNGSLYDPQQLMIK